MKGVEEEKPVKIRHCLLIAEASMRETAVFSKYRHRLISLAIILLLLAVFVPALPVCAAPIVTLVPSSGAVGTTVTINGTVFDSYEGDYIHIFFDTTEIEKSPLVVPPEGTFSIDFNIPANATAGKHSIKVKSEVGLTILTMEDVFTVDTTALTLDTAQGYAGMVVNVSGTGYYVGSQVTIYYLNITQEELGTATASPTGKFSHQIAIPLSARGFHKITASNNEGNRAEIQFEVLPELKLNLDSAGPGDPVNARGTGFSSRSTVNIIFGSINIAVAVTDDLGSFEIDFDVPDLKPYSYDVRAQDNQGNVAKTRFTVTAGANLSETTGAVGTELTVNGSGFQPGQTVTVYYDDIPVAIAVADKNGDFTATFVVPPGSGKHVITVSDGATTKKYSFGVEKEPPPVPVLLLPINESLTKAEAFFDWQDVSDESVPVVYDLQIASDRNFASPVLLKTGITESQCTLSGEEILTAHFKNSPYFWRVKAIDGAGNEGEWSDPWVFYVSVPSPPVLLSPMTDAKVRLPIRFSWEPVSSLSPPVTYTLQIAGNLDFTSPLLDKTGLTNSEHLVSREEDLKFKTHMSYYWRVKAVDNARNESDWSAAGSFYLVSISSFPGWATYTLIGVGAAIAVLLAFRAGRRTAYH